MRTFIHVFEPMLVKTSEEEVARMMHHIPDKNLSFSVFSAVSASHWSASIENTTESLFPDSHPSAKFCSNQTSFLRDCVKVGRNHYSIGMKLIGFLSVTVIS